MEQKVNRSVFRDLSYGLYLVASLDQGRLNGQVVNTVIQVTSEPPRVAVIINKKNLTHEFILKSKVFSASVLEESTPMTFGIQKTSASSAASFESLERAGITKVPRLAQQAKRPRSGETSVAGCNRHIDTGGYRQA